MTQSAILFNVFLYVIPVWALARGDQSSSITNLLARSAAAMRRLDEMLQPELQKDKGVSKALAKEGDLDTASGQSRTDDRRFTKLSAIIPNGHFTFKLEPLCQLSKTCFVRKIPTGNIPFYSVH